MKTGFDACHAKFLVQLCGFVMFKKSLFPHNPLMGREVAFLQQGVDSLHFWDEWRHLRFELRKPQFKKA
jgi:hypothetical protein